MDELERCAVLVLQAVRVVERARDLGDDVRRDPEREPPAGRTSDVVEVPARHVLHRHVELGLGAAGIEHAHDVRMVERA
jgi:hypothetical protein